MAMSALKTIGQRTMGAPGTSRERPHSQPSSAARTRAPRVTVIIPCYNYGRYLADCVHSVLAQDGVDVEAMILDDASTDDTIDVATRLADSDKRVTVVQHERNMGHVPTFNEGLANATGDYVVLISADDMLTRGSLARATAVMEARPDVGLVYGHPVVVYGNNITPARTNGRGARVWQGRDWISAQCRRGVSCIHSPEVCVRASVQRAVGGYTSTLPHSGDLEMWLRIAAVAGIARVNSDQAYRRFHGAGMLQTTFAGFLTDLRARRKAYDMFFSGPGAALPRARNDLAMAHRRLAGEALEYACLQLRSAKQLSPDLAEYVSFATELTVPEAPPMWQWREYRLLRARGERPAPLRSVSLRYSAVRHDVDRKYRWWRWRLTGV